MSSDQQTFYEKWYYAAIRDLLAITPFSGNYKKLAHMIDPAISPQEAQNAITLLKELKLIQLNSDGEYRPTSNVISATDGEEQKIILSGYASQMINQAEYALNNQDKSERMISWAGFSASKETFELIQDEVRDFRKRIMNLVDIDTNPERVYHLNIQCFPLSKRLKNEK